MFVLFCKLQLQVLLQLPSPQNISCTISSRANIFRDTFSRRTKNCCWPTSDFWELQLHILWRSACILGKYLWYHNPLLKLHVPSSDLLETPSKYRQFSPSSWLPLSSSTPSPAPHSRPPPLQMIRTFWLIYFYRVVFIFRYRSFWNLKYSPCPVPAQFLLQNQSEPSIHTTWY